MHFRWLTVGVISIAVVAVGGYIHTKLPPSYFSTTSYVSSRILELEELRTQFEDDASLWRLLRSRNGGIRALGVGSDLDMPLSEELEALYSDLMHAAQVSTASKIEDDFEVTFGTATKLDRLFVIGALYSKDASRAAADGLVAYCGQISVVEVPTGQCIRHVQGAWYVAYRWSHQP